MIYSNEYIQELLDHTLTRISTPEGSGIVFEGSIAEGFGNAGSDIDFLVVTEKEENRPVLPLIIFYDGKRIEVRYRSAILWSNISFPKKKELKETAVLPKWSGFLFFSLLNLGIIIEWCRILLLTKF